MPLALPPPGTRAIEPKLGARGKLDVPNHSVAVSPALLLFETKDPHVPLRHGVGILTTEVGDEAMES